MADSRGLTNQLGLLEQAQLLRRARLESGSTPEYQFKHGLVQETAYDSLLRNDRRRLHRLVAETLELAPAEQEGGALRLAQHWDQAGEPRRAFDYYMQAGEQAARLYSNTEALMAYDRARALADELGLSAAERLALCAQRGRVLELGGRFTDALENYRMLEEMARAEGDRATELQALIHCATLYATPNILGDWALAEKFSLRVLDMARELGDRAAQARILWSLSLARFFEGKNDEAARDGEASVALARELNLREQLAYSLNDLTRPYIFMGRAADATAAGLEAQALWRELDNLPMLADNLIGFGMFSYFTGEYRASLDQVREGLRIGEQLGNLWGQSYAHETLGLLYAQLGELDTALTHLHRGAKLGAQVNYMDAQYDGMVLAAEVYQQLGASDTATHVVTPLLNKPNEPNAWLTIPNAMLATLQAEAGDLDGARESLARAEAGYEGDAFSWGWIFVRLARTDLLLAEGKAGAALAEARAGLAELEENGLRPYRVTFLLKQALALERLERLDEALAAAQAARREAQGTDARMWLWQVLLALARLHSARGEAALAAETAHQARVELRFVLEHAPADLRERFSRRPDVRVVMQE